MAARRRTGAKAQRGADTPVPPVPGAEWVDEADFKAFWGKSIDEVIAECERESAGAEREIFWSKEEFLAALEREARM